MCSLHNSEDTGGRGGERGTVFHIFVGAERKKGSWFVCFKKTVTHLYIPPTNYMGQIAHVNTCLCLMSPGLTGCLKIVPSLPQKPSSAIPIVLALLSLSPAHTPSSSHVELGVVSSKNGSVRPVT